MKPEDIGERAYLRHLNDCNGKDTDGNRMPTWLELGERGRALFIANGMVTERVNADERNRLVEAFAISLVSGLCEVTRPDAERVIRSAERLAGEVLRRRAARGGA